ncbi:hypothetical protein D3C72_1405110 [compost metagenome]
MQNDVRVNIAEARVQEAEELLQFNHRKLVNQYEAVFVSSQELIRQDLHAEYQRYITEIFQGTESLNLPMFEGLKKAASNISFNLSVQQNDIQEKRVVIGTREVSDSTWWNPFSWGSTKTVRDYGTENFVDLEKLWKERVTRIEAEFTRLVDGARKEIEVGKDRLIEQYVAFMTREFDLKFAELLTSLSTKTTDRNAREVAVSEAKALRTWIDDFKAKLDSTLAI